jgi:protoporphyrinogen oxidase
VIGKLSCAGWIEVEEVVLVQEQILSPAYVVCRSEGRSAVRDFRQRLRSVGIHLAGRFGLWDNYSMEDALRSGVKAARDIDRRARLPEREMVI